MEQQVTVIRVDGSRARVRGMRRSACGGCAGERACKTLGSWSERFAEMEVDNALGARVGDTVTVQVPDGLLLKGAFLVYGLPMLGFILGGALGYGLAASGPLRELFSVLGALAGMGAVLGWLLHCKPFQRQAVGRIVRIEPARRVVPIMSAS